MKRLNNKSLPKSPSLLGSLLHPGGGFSVASASMSNCDCHPRVVDLAPYRLVESSFPATCLVLILLGPPRGTASSVLWSRKCARTRNFRRHSQSHIVEDASERS